MELAVKGTSDHMSYNYSGTRNNFVSFYEGGVENGKEVNIKGNANAQPRYIGDKQSGPRSTQQINMMPSTS
ncbi:hypothetical protein [Bacillus sp. m3-13]|uniref:hypothetical protein n=1 Tax=Bacillus sp. m3-13 TaxID=406124 RepID=UPI0001E89784|nr:hypothetical protein [Bacillus sp. m3-13]